MSLNNDPICPVCHSKDRVKAYKVHMRGHWWSRCHAGGKAHGDIVYPDGKVGCWPDPVYFTDSGLVGTDRGDVHITKQEYVD